MNKNQRNFFLFQEQDNRRIMKERRQKKIKVMEEIPRIEGKIAYQMNNS